MLLQAGVPPSIVDKAQNLLNQLIAVPPMATALEAKDWQALESAIAAARAAQVGETTIAPYQRQMMQLRAAARLKACLAWVLLAEAAWVGAYPTQAQLEHIRAERRHDRRSPRVVVNALAAEKDDEENERPRTIRPWPEP